MDLKDSVFSWFIQYFLNPQIEKIDSPGFVITSFSEGGKEVYLRDMFLEEQLFAMIETRIINEYGDKGKQALYSAGKKFGYLYASLSRFMRLENNEKKFLDFGYFLVRYIATIYAKTAGYEVDLKRKRLELDFENYVVCNKNGQGYIMTAGGISGIWSYMIKDTAVEGVQVKCQGRGDEKCILIAEPAAALIEEGLKPFIETDLAEGSFNEDYKRRNLARKTENARNSIKDLLNAKLFSYSKGVLRYHDIRYFHCESNVLYILENEIKKLPNGEEKLFEACSEYGKFLQQQYNQKDYKKFINDYFPALGWGDVIVREEAGKISVTSLYYPWTTYSEKSDYTVFRGIMSGFISSCKEKEIQFAKADSKITDYLTVSAYANT